MSTNYFWQPHPRGLGDCEHGTSREGLHIGKYSGGRKFLYRAWLPTDAEPCKYGACGVRLASHSEWKAFLLGGGFVYDEYSRLVEAAQLVGDIEAYQAGASRTEEQHIDVSADGFEMGHYWFS